MVREQLQGCTVYTLQVLFTTSRTIVALLFLLYASWSDYKTREVSNRTWIMFAPIAFALTLAEIIIYEPASLMFYGISFGTAAGFSMVLFYAGGFGGADAKALMCLALALPFYPSNLLTPLSGPASPISRMLFPITVFSNAVLFAAATAVYIVLRNIIGHARTGKKLFEGGQEKESVGKKFLVLVTGYKMPIEKLKDKWHLYPLEDVEETPETEIKRKLLVIPRDETRNATVERLEKAAEAGIIEKNVWATPGLPLLIFVTAGLIVALLFGDIVWVCIRLLLH
jgi:preflagellin peptidase FlaK